MYKIHLICSCGEKIANLQAGEDIEDIEDNFEICQLCVNDHSDDPFCCFVCSTECSECGNRVCEIDHYKEEAKMCTSCLEDREYCESCDSYKENVTDKMCEDCFNDQEDDVEIQPVSKEVTE